MGVPVVLVHSLRTSATMWRAQAEALAPGRLVAVPDLPGHGTRRAERFTLPGALATVDAAVDAVGGRAVVVGASLGGYVALAWAARRPDRAVGVVASGCCAAPGGPLTDAWLLASRAIVRLPDRGARLNALAVRLAVPPAGAADLAAGGFAFDVMVDALTAMRRTRPRDDLAGIACPVWLVNGRWDHFRLGERGALRAAPTARLVVVPRATHLVGLVRPTAFTRVLLEALDEIDRGHAGSRARPARASGRSGGGVDPAQRPRAHAADDPGGVRDHDDVVPERLEDRGPDAA
jgi:pimeloyl-ACP methyl ester carboxylesterase